jgi:hypothetical protein
MLIGTAQHDKVRTGTGTVRRFLGDPRLVVIGIERDIQAPLGGLAQAPEMPADRFHDGRTVFLICDPTLARSLLARYGVRDGDFTDMKGIIGGACRYVETACGMLVKLDLLAN